MNIAARLQALAEAGAAWISQSAAALAGDLVERKVACIGEQRLHRISEPVRAFRLRP